jgi:hypothetical protein
MVRLPLPALLLVLLLLLPAAAQARLTLGWVKGAAILGSEDQARRLAAHLEARLAEPVALRACADEAQLHEWLHRYRMVDLAPLSKGYFQRVPAGQLLPVAELQAGSALAQMVLRQGLRSDQQVQLRTLLANLPEEPAGRDLLASLNGLRLSPPVGAPRAGFAAPAPPRSAPPAVSWPDEAVAARPTQPQPPSLPAAPEPLPIPEPAQPPAVALPELPAAAPPTAATLPETEKPVPPLTAAVDSLPAAPAVVPVLPSPLPEPPAAVEPAPPAVVEAPPVAAAVPEPVKVLEKTPPLPVPAAQSPVAAPPAAAVVAEPVTVVDKLVPPVPPVPAAPPVKPVVEAPAPQPQLKLAALPAKPPVAAPPEVKPKLPEETVARSLSSGRQPLTDAKGLQTIYLVPFTTVMVPLPVAEAVFDQFVETLNASGPAAGYDFVILKDDLERVDPAWLRKATYVTGEIFGYVEESGCCSTDIRTKSRLALYRPGSSEPKLSHEYPAKAFFDHDYSSLATERKKLAERISQDLSGRLIQALGGG